MVSISEVELLNPRHCFKSREIGANNLEVDFTVTVDRDGCYAIAVVVSDEDDFSLDDVIASNLANSKLKCLCLKRGQAKKFAINGGGSGPKPTPQAGRIQLDNMTGLWPTDDGVLDNTLALYVTIEVFACSYDPCQEGRECDKYLNTGRFDDYTAVGSYTNEDSPQKTEIVDGEGVDRFTEVVRTGVSAGSAVKPLIPISQADNGLADPYAALILRQARQLDREIAVVTRRIGAVEAALREVKETSGPRLTEKQAASPRRKRKETT